MRNETGFATLEIIFVLLIIAVLAAATIPNAVRVFDMAALDYETKLLYSELRFLQTSGKMTTFNTQGTGRNNFILDEKISLNIKPATLSRQVLRGKNEVRPEHSMKNIRSIVSPSNTISFDSEGKASITSNQIVLTSERGKQLKIIFDSVGRFRRGRADERAN